MYSNKEKYTYWQDIAQDKKVQQKYKLNNMKYKNNAGQTQLKQTWKNECPI